MPSSRYLAYVVGLLFLVNVVNYMDRSIIGVLIEPMRRELQFSDTQIGLLTGFAFAAFYAVAGLFVAYLADLRSRKLIMCVSIVAWSAMTALTGAAQNFWHLLVARFGVGAGEAGVIPASYALLADYYPPQRRALAMGIFTSGAMIGVMAGSMLGGHVAQEYGWRWAFVAAALPGVPLAILVALTLREPRKNTGTARPPPFLTALREICSSRTTMLLIVGFGFITFMLFGIVTWFPTFLIRRFGVTLSSVGAWFGIAAGAGTAVGTVLGGWVANRLAARDLRWLIRIPMVLTLTMFPLYELAIFAPTFSLSLVALGIVSAVGGCAYGPVLAAVQTALPANLKATGAAVNGFMASVVGIGSAPLVVGMLSDAYSQAYGSSGALQRALAIAVSAAVIGFVFLFMAARAASIDGIFSRRAS